MRKSFNELGEQTHALDENPFSVHLFIFRGRRGVRSKTGEKTERLRAQVEKLNRMLFGTRSKKLRQQVKQATVQRAE